MHRRVFCFSAKARGVGTAKESGEGKMSDDLVLKLTKGQYQVLKGVMVLDEGADAMVQNATPAAGGFVLTGSSEDFDDLAGFVTAEANHTESQRKQDILDEVYDRIEELLET